MPFKFKHPLEVVSLAPYGLATNVMHERLNYKASKQGDSFWVNREIVLARLWERRNRTDAPRPLPIETIIHDILPRRGKDMPKQADFVFEQKPYLTRDIRILSSIVQWFGTNVGSCFLDEPLFRPPRGYREEREFLVKFQRSRKNSDYLTMWTHFCTPKCYEPHYVLPFGNPCLLDYREVTKRDEAVVDGLLRWLGTPDGRAFIAWYRKVNRRLQALAGVRRRARFLSQAVSIA